MAVPQGMYSITMPKKLQDWYKNLKNSIESEPWPSKKWRAYDRNNRALTNDKLNINEKKDENDENLIESSDILIGKNDGNISDENDNILADESTPIKDDK